MYELARSARKAMKAKAHHLASGDPHAKVDASSWTPPEMLETESKTGLRPVSRRQYKRGGKVAGEHSHHRADRRPRKSGGRNLVNELVNRDVKAANEEREGVKHVGGMKRGGRAHHADGGPLAGAISQGIGGQGRMSFNYPSASRGILKHGGKAHSDESEDRALVRRMVKPSALVGKTHGGEVHHRDCHCERCGGGRAERASGGKTGEKWIKGAIKHPGFLHRALHVPQGEKIPAKKMAKAKHSKNKHVMRAANLAETLKGMHHARGGRANWDEDEDYGPAPGERGFQARAGRRTSEDAIIRALRSHGADFIHKGGVLHAVGHWRDPSTGQTGVEHVPIGNSVSKLRDFLGYTKGGTATDGSIQGTRPTGGRRAHARGGRTGKGKMNVNIVIAPGHGAQRTTAVPGGMFPPQPQGAPVPMPVGSPAPQVPVPVPVAGAPMGGMGAGMGGLGGMPAGLPRKRGGRASTVAHHMAEHGGGAGGGLGRLEKIRVYGENAEPDKEHY